MSPRLIFLIQHCKYNNIYQDIEMQPHDAFEKFYNLYKRKIKILYLKNIAVIKKTNY